MVNKGSAALWIGFAIALVGLIVVIVLNFLRKRKMAGLKPGDKVYITFPVTMALFGGKSPGGGADTGTKVNVTLYGTIASTTPATPGTPAKGNTPAIPGKPATANITWTLLKSDGAGQKAIAKGDTPPTGWNSYLCDVDKAVSFDSLFFGTSSTNPLACRGICITPNTTADMRNFLAAHVWPQSVGVNTLSLKNGESTTVSGQTTAESAQGVFDMYQIGKSGCSMSGNPDAPSMDPPFMTEESMLQGDCLTGHPMRHAMSNWGMALAGQERMTPSGCNQALITVSDDASDGCYPVEWADKPLKTASQIKYRNIPQSTYWEASRNLGALPAYTLAL
jgi:hypothetical protein